MTRILLWHGWLLQGTGSNVFTSEVAKAFRREGHDVVIVCQEPHPERLGFIDAWASIGADRVLSVEHGSSSEGGRCVVLRPDIGPILPVFVLDEYAGFRVVRFVDLTQEELEAFLERSVAALQAAVQWHRPEFVLAGHAMPGPVVARMALGTGAYVAIVHGSELEYAVAPQARYRDLTIEGLEGASAVLGLSDDVLRRAIDIVPSIRGRTRRIRPGVDSSRFHPQRPSMALAETARALAADPDTVRGRPASTDVAVREALAGRDASRLDALAHSYDQTVPDAAASIRLLELSRGPGPLIGYFGKLIAQKGVHLFLQALPRLPAVQVVIAGFGLHREWLTALVQALDNDDAATVEWLAGAGHLEGGGPAGHRGEPGLQSRVVFTGRIDHRYAPGVLAALDVLVVPSIANEAFGLVAAEAASAGALPLVARHSGLAEVSAALEDAVGRPGLFSYGPGDAAVENIADGVEALLSIDAEERARLRRLVADFVSREWTWKRVASELLGN